MDRIRLLLVITAALVVGCTSSTTDDAADDLAPSEAETATSEVVAAEPADAEPAPAATASAPPSLAAVLEAGGAETDVAECQAEVLAAAGVREVDDLDTMAEAMEGLTEADQQAMVDCVN